METAQLRSSMKPIAEISSVGGMAWRSPSAVRYSLLSESFPEMNGLPKSSAVSKHPRAASSRSPSVSGCLGSPQQKLSRRAIRPGSAPTAAALRTASSIALAAIR